MDFKTRWHMRLRFWRYRLRTEKASLSFLRQQSLRGSTVIDIGANYGIYSYWMSRQVGPEGRVIAFEPQPELWSHLDDLKQAFGLNNVSFVHEALSDHAGPRLLKRSCIGHGGAKIETPEAESTDETSYEPVAGDSDKRVNVSTVTLDEYCEEQCINEIDFIKCDVEGHELSVFRGGEHALRAFQPILLFECEHQAAEQGELFGFLEELGYEGAFFSDGEAVDWQGFADHPYRNAKALHRNYIALPRAA